MGQGDPVLLRRAQSPKLPVFLTAPASYEVVWPSGERESIRVARIADQGWALVDGRGRPRWVNLSQARSIEQLP
jgi:hypothetical protein